MTVSNKVMCPDCETVLKLATSQTPGKKIKCPKCGAKFELADEPAPTRKSKGKVQAEGASKKDRDKSRKPGQNSAKAEKNPAKQTNDDGDGGQTYGFFKEEEEDDENKPKISYAPDTSIKDLRGPAQAAVVGPTNFLLLTGALGFFGWVGLLITLLIPVCFPIAADEGTKDSPLKVLDLPDGLGIVGGSTGPGAGGAPPGKEDIEQPWLQFFGMDLSQLANCTTGAILGIVFAIVVMMGYSAVLIMGAVQAQNLESRQWGIASSIMAMVPLNTGGLIMVLVVLFGFGMRMLFDDANWFLIPLVVILCLAGVGVGVWNLITFFQEKVIAGYEFVPE